MTSQIASSQTPSAWSVITAPVFFTVVSFALAVLAKDVLWLAITLTIITGVFLTVSLFAIVWQCIDPASFQERIRVEFS